MAKKCKCLLELAKPKEDTQMAETQLEQKDFALRAMQILVKIDIVYLMRLDTKPLIIVICQVQ